MGDLFAFLDAIAEAPGDDTPRLVFADWLEDRGDPRGPAVRVADAGVVRRLFAAEQMRRCEDAGDVEGWRRFGRIRFFEEEPWRGGSLRAFDVSAAFLDRLLDHAEAMSDLLGGCFIRTRPGSEVQLLFMRVPVVIRDEQPVGA